MSKHGRDPEPPVEPDALPGDPDVDWDPEPIEEPDQGALPGDPDVDWEPKPRNLALPGEPEVYYDPTPNVHLPAVIG